MLGAATEQPKTVNVVGRSGANLLTVLWCGEPPYSKLVRDVRRTDVRTHLRGDVNLMIDVRTFDRLTDVRSTSENQTKNRTRR